MNSMQLAVTALARGLLVMALSATLTTAVAQQISDSILPTVVITMPRWVSSDGPATSGFRVSTQPDEANLQKLGDVLVDAGLAGWDAGGSLGLATTVQSRGFSVNPQSSTGLSAGKILLNGHPDVGRRFVRDPITVESINYFGMTDAALAGASTPAGTVLIVSKTPTGQPHFEYGLTGASNGLTRLTVDAEQHYGPMQMRLVAASQTGDKTVEGATDSHSTVLLSSRLAVTGSSTLRFDVESQTAHLPFPFGMVYAGNQFWYGRSYVDTAQSKATRLNDRIAGYWDVVLDDNTSVHAHAQVANGRRNEDLLGFWTVTSPTTLNSYARHIDEKFDQTDVGVSVEHTLKLGAQTHRARLSYSDSLQTLDFVGPQSIGAFSIDLADPQFSTPFSAINLTPRSLKERYSEKTLSVTDRVIFSPAWNLDAAATQNLIHIQSSATSAPMTQVAAHDLTSFALTANHQVSNSSRWWLSFGNAFEPNRGLMKSGDFLPPKQARQTELGMQYKQEAGELQVSLYDIYQSNLAGLDPSDKNYVIPVGAAQSRGLQFTARRRFDTVALYVGATLQHARVTTPTSASQGQYLPGIADHYGALGCTWQPHRHNWPTLDLKTVVTGARPGDSAGSFFAPGAAIWNLNVSGKVTGNSGAQWSVGVANLFDRRFIRAISASDYVWQGDPRRLTVTWRQTL